VALEAAKNAPLSFLRYSTVTITLRDKSTSVNPGEMSAFIISAKPYPVNIPFMNAA
jgi:hypothetical protein